MILIEVKGGMIQRITSDDPGLKCGIVDYDVLEEGPYVARFNHGLASLSEIEPESTHAVDNPRHESAEARIERFNRLLFSMEQNQSKDMSDV
jgi:hypothetical protein